MIMDEYVLLGTHTFLEEFLASTKNLEEELFRLVDSTLESLKGRRNYKAKSFDDRPF